MLTGDLVRARSAGKEIRPSFVDPGHAGLLERAQDLVAVFERGLREAWPRERLQQEQREIEGFGTDHKLTKGLYKVLEDAAEFATQAPLDPALLRARVFALGASHGPLGLSRASGRPTAFEVLAPLALELGSTPEDLQRALYADRKDQQILVEVDLPTPRGLLERYNVALVQALLLRAHRLQVRLHAPDPKRLRQLLARLRFHELLFRARQEQEEDGDVLVLEVDGPESLLRWTTRYGLQLASFVPTLLLHERAWSLHAEVLVGRRNLRKTLHLDHTLGLRSHARDVGAWTGRAEAQFPERFGAERAGWVLSPGTPLVVQGQELLAPDFELRRIVDGQEQIGHLQFMPLWRRERVLRLLEQAPRGYLVALPAKMSVDRASTLPAGALPYREFLAPDAVVEALELAFAPSRATSGQRATSGRAAKAPRAAQPKARRRGARVPHAG